MGKGITSEGAKAKVLPYKPVLEHPSPVTKLNRKVTNLPIHLQVYPVSMQAPTPPVRPV